MPENVPGITCRQSRKMIHNCSIGYTGGKRIMHKPKKQQPMVNYPLYKSAAIRIFAENPGNWEAFKRLVSTAARPDNTIHFKFQGGFYHDEHGSKHCSKYSGNKKIL